MINFHPEIDLLLKNAFGALNPLLSAGINAHIDMCPHCADIHGRFEEMAASKFFKENEETEKMPFLEKEIDTIIDACLTRIATSK
jgi:anti-sigma factor ChrR (cupin superfamily)